MKQKITVLIIFYGLMVSKIMLQLFLDLIFTLNNLQIKYNGDEYIREYS